MPLIFGITLLTETSKGILTVTLILDENNFLLFYVLHPSIHRSMGTAPVGAQCPLTSSLGEFPGY